MGVSFLNFLLISLHSIYFLGVSGPSSGPKEYGVTVSRNSSIFLGHCFLFFVLNFSVCFDKSLIVAKVELEKNNGRID